MHALCNTLPKHYTAERNCLGTKLAQRWRQCQCQCQCVTPCQCLVSNIWVPIHQNTDSQYKLGDKECALTNDCGVRGRTFSPPIMKRMCTMGHSLQYHTVLLMVFNFSRHAKWHTQCYKQRGKELRKNTICDNWKVLNIFQTSFSIKWPVHR